VNRLLLLGAVLLAAGCGMKPVGAEASRDPAYVFPHRPHLDGEVPCLKCHVGIDKGTKLDISARHVALPKNPSKNADCNGCHSDDPKITVPTRTVPFRFTFDHSKHLPLVKNDCQACHKKLVDKNDAQAPVPPMAACTACHKHQADYAEARCTPCHRDLKGYKPETNYAHGGDWLRLHGQFAKPTAESCAQCHDQTYCAPCHSAQTAAARPSVIFPEEVQRSFIHRGDYVSRHVIEAQSSPASCTRCHGSPFCDSCHIQNGVSASLGASARNPHPSSFFQTHGQAARRDISSCAGCHDQGAKSLCVTCHATAIPGTAAGSPNGPHPASFISAHKGEDKTKNKMCLACHTS